MGHRGGGSSTFVIGIVFNSRYVSGTGIRGQARCVHSKCGDTSKRLYRRGPALQNPSHSIKRARGSQKRETTSFFFPSQASRIPFAARDEYKICNVITHTRLHRGLTGKMQPLSSSSSSGESGNFHDTNSLRN